MPYSLDIFNVVILDTFTVSQNLHVHLYKDCGFGSGHRMHGPIYDCSFALVVLLLHLIFVVVSLSQFLILSNFIPFPFQCPGEEMHLTAQSSMMRRLVLHGLQLSKMWQRIPKMSSSTLTVSCISFLLFFPFFFLCIIILTFHMVKISLKYCMIGS